MLLVAQIRVDPMEDQYAKRREEKKERVDKNKKQQRRNAEEAQAIAAGQNPREARKQQLKEKLLTTRKATASLGKFDKKLKDEPKLKSGEKRKVP
jgi:regulator of ribosome biosynthesis